MNGRKWSELGFEFGPGEMDKTVTVKKANKKGNVAFSICFVD